jgi:hypothetical protein
VIAGDLPDIPEYMNVASLKVHAPTAVVIVCGGETEIDFNKPILSLRDALLRIASRQSLSKFDIRKAEDIVRLPQAGYEDLLQLESDVSQISELVMLFSESEGSFAELGVFSMDEEVSPKLLVVVDRYNYLKDSFIRRGILDYLEARFGGHTVCVIDLNDHGAHRIENVAGLDLDSFAKFIEGKIADRLAERPEPSSFAKDRSGHLIKLMTGLIQNYASLTFGEIKDLLKQIGVEEEDPKIKRLLGCADLFSWIKIEKNGVRTFYSALPGPLAMQFDQPEGTERVNRNKWRSDVRQYWKETDPDRFKCISAAAGAGA